MPTFPLPTLACTIDATGIHSPAFEDILNSLHASFQGIYGADSYIDPDSQDGQMLAVFAQGQYDSNQATIAAYNNYSPTTSQGTGLSSMIKINGLQRNVSSFSTALITVTGNAGISVINGLVGDNQNLGTQWALPTPTVIPPSGSIVVTATATVKGAISASANTLTQMLNPQVGWQSVTNAVAAVPGQAVETDAQTRIRQSNSTALPAQAITSGIYAAVANITGVTRVAVYDNDTKVPDKHTIPGNSIAVIVNGGSTLAIAQAIALKKTPGTGTFGTVSNLVLDSQGMPATINYFPLTNVTITAAISLRALTGYLSTTGVLVGQVVAAAINSLPIGGIVFQSRLWAAANLSGDIATTTSGLSQTQLDALAATFQVSSINISRAANSPLTLVANGPYSAGSVSIAVVDPSDLYIGMPISLILSDGSNFNTVVTSITNSGQSGNVTIGLRDAIPAGKQLNTAALLFPTTDVAISFNEAANAPYAIDGVTPTSVSVQAT